MEAKVQQAAAGATAKKGNTKKVFKVLERITESVFFLCAAAAVLALSVIVIFLFIQGIPALREIGLWNFISGTTWQPSANEFGILPMIVASLLATFGSALIGGFIGLMAALLLAELAPNFLANIIRPLINLLAGIPSVVYGFFGLMVVVPMIIQVFGGTGNSLLATILILAAMILPTMVSLSETAVRAVPQAYREGSLALGATHMQTIFRVTLPAAKSGVLNAFVLSLGRAIGETMAVILVAGNRASIPTSILDPVRPMTANIALELSYATGLHAEALYATGVVLLVFIVIINITAHIVLRNKKEG